jgi:hypothetical protein
MIPIYRAKKIDSDEYVKGTGISDFMHIYKYVKNYNDGSKLWLWSNYSWIQVDPSILAISFDNGYTWFDMENAERAFAEYMKTHGYEGIQQ